MITLKEALALTKTGDKDICYLRRLGDEWHEVMSFTGKEVRDKYDLRTVNVHTILPRFTCGDWTGMEFEVSGLEKKKSHKGLPLNQISHGKYSVQEVANFILRYMRDGECQVTNLHLQGLLYYLWVGFYQRTGEWLFDERFEARKFGPAIRTVYDKYCLEGGLPIVKIGRFNIHENDQRIMREVLQTYKDVSLAKIVERLHECHKPWFAAYDCGRGEQDSIPFESIINKECRVE